MDFCYVFSCLFSHHYEAAAHNKGVSDLEMCQCGLFPTSTKKLLKFEFSRPFVLKMTYCWENFLATSQKIFWANFSGFLDLMAKLFMRENRNSNLFLKVHNNPDSFLNLRHLYYILSGISQGPNTSIVKVLSCLR